MILTHPDDVHANAVQRLLLGAGVLVHRLDSAQIGTPNCPVNAHIVNGRATGQIGLIDLERVGIVWHRRPSIPDGSKVDVAELTAAVGGLLAGIPHLNSPVCMAAALKPHQLVVAALVGLNVPETLISTQRGTAEAFTAGLGGHVVVKSMSREAREVVSDVDRKGWLRACHLTQRRIDKKHDVRVTVIDDVYYAARIDSPHLDWRVNSSDAVYNTWRVPPAVNVAIGQLMRRLGLRFAALDFAVDQLDRWWFLEANPNGQFLWIEDATGMPISTAVARALAPWAVEES